MENGELVGASLHQLENRAWTGAHFHGTTVGAMALFQFSILHSQLRNVIHGAPNLKLDAVIPPNNPSSWYTIVAGSFSAAPTATMSGIK